MHIECWAIAYPKVKNMAVIWRFYLTYQLIKGMGTYSDTYKWVFLKNEHMWTCIQKLWNELACRCEAAFCLIALWMSEVIFLWRGSVELQADRLTQGQERLHHSQIAAALTAMHFTVAWSIGRRRCVGL